MIQIFLDIPRYCLKVNFSRHPAIKNSTYYFKIFGKMKNFAKGPSINYVGMRGGGGIQMPMLLHKLMY